MAVPKVHDNGTPVRMWGYTDGHAEPGHSTQPSPAKTGTAAVPGPDSLTAGPDGTPSERRHVGKNDCVKSS